MSAIELQADSGRPRLKDRTPRTGLENQSAASIEELEMRDERTPGVFEQGTVGDRQAEREEAERIAMTRRLEELKRAREAERRARLEAREAQARAEKLTRAEAAIQRGDAERAVQLLDGSALESERGRSLKAFAERLVRVKSFAVRGQCVIASRSFEQALAEHGAPAQGNLRGRYLKICPSITMRD